MYAAHVSLAAGGQAMIMHASGNMAILLTSSLFGFEISFLSKYRVNYYDYIIK